MSTPPLWVTALAELLKDTWTIGTYSSFADEVDFDTATVEEIAKVIWEGYQMFRNDNAKEKQL